MLEGRTWSWEIHSPSFTLKDPRLQQSPNPGQSRHLALPIAKGWLGESHFNSRKVPQSFLLTSFQSRKSISTRTTSQLQQSTVLRKFTGVRRCEKLQLKLKGVKQEMQCLKECVKGLQRRMVCLDSEVSAKKRQEVETSRRIRHRLKLHLGSTSGNSGCCSSIDHP